MKSVHLSRVIPCVLAVIASTAMFAQSYPVPFINEPLAPPSKAPGSPSFLLTVNGAEFVAGATIEWHGKPLATTFINHDQLTAQVPSPELFKAGTSNVTVANPAPGGTSNIVPFNITQPTSLLTWKMVTNTLGFMPSGAVIADFDGDGKPDVAVFNATPAQNGSISVFLGSGKGKVSAGSQLTVKNGNPIGGIAADFNQDGKMDLAVISSANCMGCAEITIFLGNGDGTFTTAYQSPGLDGDYFSLLAGDFNGDGKLDLAAAYNPAIGLPNVAIYLGNGDGTFTANPTNVVNSECSLLATGMVAGDFNGDGILDLAVAGQDCTTSGTILPLAIFLGNGDGTFSSATTQPTTTLQGPEGLVAADFDGDGILDLAVADNRASSIAVLHGNGDGTFTQVRRKPAVGSPLTVSAADMNGDGKVDLVVSSTAPPALSVLLGNGNATFGKPLSTPAPTGSIFSAIADFNLDGRPDLVITDPSSNSVAVLLQSPFATFSTGELRFGNESLGVASSPLQATLHNTGSAHFYFTNISILGVNPGDFTQTNNCGKTLNPGQSCTFEVTFTPEATGARSAEIRLVDNACKIFQTVKLYGAGVR